MDISFFKSAMAKNHSLVSADDFFESIRSGRWKSEIIALRECLNTHGKEVYNKKKKLLNAVTLSGNFNGRNAENLIEYSGLLQGDIDEVKEPEKLRDALSLDPHVRASFLSPSGRGVKLAIKVPENPDGHTDYFLTAQEYFKKNHGVELDNSCKDIARLLFVSYDEDIKGNEDCIPLKIERDDLSSGEGGLFFDATKVLDDPTKSDYEKAEVALQNINPEEYDTWFKVGCSLKAMLGESGFALWDSWSSKSSKYNPKEMRYKWNTISQEGGVTGGTVMQHFEIGSPVMIPRPKKSVEKKKEEEIPTLSPEMCYPIGFVGELAKFITDNSRYPQPTLALPASLAFTATLLGRKVCTEDDIRPNLYMVGLGRTGIGKEMARAIIKKLFAECGIQGFGAEKVSSRTAIERVLSATPSALFLFDEFGKYVSSILGEKSSGHVRDVMTALMELYTSSASMFYGTDKANARENPRFQIAQPHSNIYGTSTPETFWEGLSHSAIRDGSLNRFLVFSALNERPQRQMTQRIKEFPQELKNSILRLNNLTENVKISSTSRLYDPKKFIDHYGETVNSSTIYKQPLDRDFGEITCDPDPMTIYYSKEAIEIFDNFEDKCLDKADKPTTTASMWVRASEHSKKIALILSASNFLNEIPPEFADYSTKLVSIIMKNTIREIIRNLADNYAEKESKRVEEIIRECKNGITLSDLTRKTRFLKSRSVRKNIIEDLYEAEILNVESRSSTNGKTTTYYFCE